MADKPVTAIVRNIEPQNLLQSAIEKGASIETLERLLALAKEVRAEVAKEAYNHAMSVFQQTCPPVKKTDKANIRTKSGSSYSYSYSPLETIMETIVPVMAPLGLSVSYRMQHEAQKVVAVARISHELGHFEESGPVAMPIVVADFGANPAQCVGIAATYARRYALLAITGIAPQGEDTDGNPNTNGHAETTKPAAQSQPQTAQPTQTVAPPAQTEPARAVLGEIKGTLERVAIKTSSGGKAYAVFTLNGRSVTAWDTKVHPFLVANDGNDVAAVIESKGKYNNLISMRLLNVSELPDAMDQQDEPPITDSPF